MQSAAQRLVAEHRPCHLVWNPSTGEIAQLISVLRAGRALGAPDRLDWTPVRIHRRPENVNAEGRVCVQIGVLALAAEPFTNGPLIGVEAIMSWLDSWGVPRRWPGGPARRLGRGAGRRPRGAARRGRGAATSARRRSPGARTSGRGRSTSTGSPAAGRTAGGATRELPSPFAAAALPIPA